MLLLGIAQGFFLSITLPVVHQKNRAANKILALQLVLACLALVTRMVFYKAEEIWIVQRVAVLETCIFLLGPLGYIYLKRLLGKGLEKYRLPWFHYLPASMYLSYLVYINAYTTEVFAQHWASGQFSTPFFIAESAALIFNLLYWYLGGRFFLRVLKKEKEQLSFTQATISFIRVMLFVSGMILLAWIVSFYSTYFLGAVLPIVNYNLVWVAIPVLIYVVGYFALRQPEIFRVSVSTGKPKTGARPVMDQKRIKELQDNLAELMDTERIHLHNELTLASLAKRLDTSTNKLSWLLNTVYDTNFYDFINTYRIKEFVAKLDRNEHKRKTLLSLSMEVGFNSKSTFNKAFKATLNETPTSYIKRVAG